MLGSFRIVRALGQGSFATAYLAEQVGTDRKAVVKIAHAHLIHSERGDAIRERFSSELRAATRVTHPNLVTIYTGGETHDGLPALAMEYLEGETLGQRLQRGDRLTVDELVRGFTQLASALARVHASKIIHRDISPGNVFLTRDHDGFAFKLLDFGVARLQDRESTGNHVIGTPHYMALEQLQGEAVTASDVYAVGALLWWCFTGQELFSHLGSLTELVYHLQTQHTAPDPRAVCPAMPPRAARLVSSMLERKPSQRPTMASFLNSWTALEPELRDWCASLQGRQIAVFLQPGPLDAFVASLLRRCGHDPLRLPPRVSSLVAHPGLDAIVLDAELAEPDAYSLAKHLLQVLPHVQLCIVSARPFFPAWGALPVRLLALLPEHLPRLQEALANPGVEPLPRVLTADDAHRALGEVPEQVAGIEECASQNDKQGVITHCERIERVAFLASLDELGSVARTLRVLTEGDAVDDFASFLEQLQRAFHEVFPRLLAAQNEGLTQDE